MPLRPNLMFAGNAETALTHYRAALGGDLEIIRFAGDVEDEQHAADLFAKLAADGTILMPFEPTFFARKFGMTNDKFGVKWMVNVPRTGE